MFLDLFAQFAGRARGIIRSRIRKKRRPAGHRPANHAPPSSTGTGDLACGSVPARPRTAAAIVVDQTAPRTSAKRLARSTIWLNTRSPCATRGTSSRKVSRASSSFHRFGRNRALLVEQHVQARCRHRRSAQSAVGVVTIPAASWPARAGSWSREPAWLMTLMPIWISTLAQNCVSLRGRICSAAGRGGRLAIAIISSARSCMATRRRQIAVARRTLTIDELQADAMRRYALCPSSPISSHRARRFVEAKPMHRLADARQHVPLRSRIWYAVRVRQPRMRR